MGHLELTEMSFLLKKVIGRNHLCYDKVLWFLSWNIFFFVQEKYFVRELLKNLIVLWELMKKLVEIEKRKQTNKEEKKQENEKAEIKWNKYALHILTVYFSLCSQ